jgi:hypothetical protein
MIELFNIYSIVSEDGLQHDRRSLCHGISVVGDMVETSTLRKEENEL